jgi:hypothetical protein
VGVQLPKREVACQTVEQIRSEKNGAMLHMCGHCRSDHSGCPDYGIVSVVERNSRGRVLAFDVGLHFLYSESLSFPSGLAVCVETLFVAQMQGIDAFSFQGVALRHFQVGSPAPSITGFEDAILVLATDGSSKQVVIISAHDGEKLHSRALPNVQRSNSRIGSAPTAGRHM